MDSPMSMLIFEYKKLKRKKLIFKYGKRLKDEHLVINNRKVDSTCAYYLKKDHINSTEEEDLFYLYVETCLSPIETERDLTRERSVNLLIAIYTRDGRMLFDLNLNLRDDNRHKLISVLSRDYRRLDSIINKIKDIDFNSGCLRHIENSVIHELRNAGYSNNNHLNIWTSVPLNEI